jgi:hypothetical protein
MSTHLRHSWLFALVLLFLTSCAESGGRHLVNEEGNGEPSVQLSLRAFRKVSEDTFQVGVTITNPDRQPITSVRAWVKFPAEELNVIDLTLEDGRFSLVAPGEWNVDPGGLVNIGVAASKPVQDAEITVASFLVTLRAEGRFPLTFYDWRPDGRGHTTVLRVGAGGDVIPLLSPPLPLVLP